MTDTLIGLGLTMAMMLIILSITRFAFGAICRLEGYSFTRIAVIDDNPAIGIRMGSLLLAVIVSFVGAIHPSGINLQEDLNLLAWYGLLVIFFILVSRYVNDYLILYGFHNNLEVVCGRNVAVATVEAATYLATAFIISGALLDWEGGFFVSIIWFAIGQAFLILLGFIYRVFVRGVFEALTEHNHACALSMGGFLLAGGIALGAAVTGPFDGWTQDLQAVLIYVAAWLALMIITHLFADHIILPTVRLRTEVMDDRNIGAGIIEGMLFIGATVFFTRVW